MWALGRPASPSRCADAPSSCLFATIRLAFLPTLRPFPSASQPIPDRFNELFILFLLSSLSFRPLSRSFTPHLMPMTRGMESSCYVKMAPGVTVADLRKCLEVGWVAGLAGWTGWLGG